MRVSNKDSIYRVIRAIPYLNEKQIIRKCIILGLYLSPSHRLCISGRLNELYNENKVNREVRNNRYVYFI